MITATTWIPRGFAAEYPEKYELDEDELNRISELAKLQLEDAQKDLADAKDEENKMENDNEGQGDDDEEEEEEEDITKDEDLKEYDFEHYDDDEESEGEPFMFGGSKTVTFHQDGEKDPYITLPQAEEEEEDRQELQIMPTDNLVLAARTEDDLSYLEVYVYDDTPDEDGTRNNLYVHHDFMLPSFPLCVEWMNYRVGRTRGDGSSDNGNFVAVGTFEPEIEIWNLDVVDSVFPDLVLGQRPDDTTGPAVPKVSKKNKKKKKTISTNDQYHVDAVLSLSANQQHRNLLASGSADTTVKLWDLSSGACAKSYSFHSDKVSSVAWNPVEGSVLLSGGYDSQIIASDLRTEGSKRTWKVNGDVEGLKWDRNGHDFYVSTESGRIHKFDARQEGKSVWTLQAHDTEVTSFDISNNIGDFMVTGSTDKTVKLWNLNSASAGGGPSMILSRDLDIGKVFSVQFGPDDEVSGHIIASGSSGGVKVWDTLTNRTVREVVNGRLSSRQQQKKLEERIVGVDDDDEEEEEDDGDDQVQEDEDSDE